MEILWSPWRSEYIKSFKDEEQNQTCFICEAINNPTEKVSRLVVFSSHSSIVLMNKFPYNAGHLLVCPVKHIPIFDELSESELLDLFQSIRKSLNVLNKSLKPHGFNIGVNIGRVAGAGLPEHVHFHIIPRWNGDTSFITLVSDTKVVSQAMDEIYNMLVKAFDEIS
ncbi:MAG: HIT domain-containing protein [Ignavibacteria bacterium]|nr:HIT domain-containing protein [Ignavibacteria bacterium]